jgi:hypothetical protein
VFLLERLLVHATVKPHAFCGSRRVHYISWTRYQICLQVTLEKLVCQRLRIRALNSGVDVADGSRVPLQRAQCGERLIRRWVWKRTARHFRSDSSDFLTFGMINLKLTKISAFLVICSSCCVRRCSSWSKFFGVPVAACSKSRIRSGANMRYHGTCSCWMY